MMSRACPHILKCLSAAMMISFTAPVAGLAGQEPPPRTPVCCTHWDTSHASVSMSVTWTLHPIGWTPTEIPALVGASVARYNLGWDLCLRTVVCCPEAISPYFYGDLDADGDDVLLRQITASAYESPAVQAEAWMSGLSGASFISHRTDQWEEFGYLQINKESQWLEDCEFHGQSFSIDLSHASAGWTAELAGPCALEVDLNWSAIGERASADTCICEIETFPGSLNPGKIIRHVNHVVIKVVATYANETSDTEVLRGLNALDMDMTRTRLGFFEDAEFDGGWAGDTFSGSVAGFALPTSIDLENAVSVVVTGTAESFSEQNGDLTPTGEETDVICWADRYLFAQAYGSSFGDELYNPRADFDLDGDIDSDDYAEYLAIFNANACAADFNCDGVVEVPDIFAFQSAWFASEFAADFDGNGLVEVPDMFAFLSAWFAGC